MVDIQLPQSLAAYVRNEIIADPRAMADYTSWSRSYRRLSADEIRKAPIVEHLSFGNPVMCAYVFWSIVLVVKMAAVWLAIVWLERVKFDTNNNDTKTAEEDAAAERPPQMAVRLRRSLRNDAENILPLCVVGFFYVLAGPNVRLSVDLFRLIGFGRLAHTLLYTVLVLPQPARFVAFFVPYCAIGFMAIKATMFFHSGQSDSEQPMWAKL